jgi:hypothetical protein
MDSSTGNHACADRRIKVKEIAIVFNKKINQDVLSQKIKEYFPKSDFFEWNEFVQEGGVIITHLKLQTSATEEQIRAIALKHSEVVEVSIMESIKKMGNTKESLNVKGLPMDKKEMQVEKIEKVVKSMNHEQTRSMMDAFHSSIKSASDKIIVLCEQFAEEKSGSVREEILNELKKIQEDLKKNTFDVKVLTETLKKIDEVYGEWSTRFEQKFAGELGKMLEGSKHEINKNKEEIISSTNKQISEFQNSIKAQREEMEKQNVTMSQKMETQLVTMSALEEKLKFVDSFVNGMIAFTSQHRK